MAASVKVLINALTQSAQSSLEEVGDDIRGLKPDASVAASGLNNVEEELESTTRGAGVLSVALQGLQSALRDTIAPSHRAASAIDDVGDESTETAAQTGILSGAFGVLSISTSGLAASMGILSTSLYGVAGGITAIMLILAPLIPVLATAVGAFGALAAIFGVIIGSGFAAWMKQTGTTMKELMKTVKRAIQSFGQQFLPLIKDAIALLPSFINRIGKAVGSLDPFVHALRVLGSIAYRVIPPLIGVFANLARAVLPFVLDAARWIGARLVPALKALFNAGQRAAGEVYRLAKALFQIGKSLAGVAGWVGRLAVALYDLAAAALGVGKLTQELARVGQIMKTGLRGAIQWLSSTGVTLLRKAFSFLATQALSAFQFGKQHLVPAIRRGITAAFRWVRTRGVVLAKSALAFLATQAINAFKFGKQHLVPAIRRGITAAFRWVRTRGVALAKKALAFLATQAINAFKFGRQHLVPAVRRGITAAWRWVRTRGVALAKKALLALAKRASATFKRALRLAPTIRQIATQFKRLIPQLTVVGRAFKRIQRFIMGLIRRFTSLTINTRKLKQTIGGAGLAGAAVFLATIFRGPLLAGLRRVTTYLIGPLSRGFRFVRVAASRIGTVLASRVIPALTRLLAPLRRVALLLVGRFGRGITLVRSGLARVSALFSRLAPVIFRILSPIKRLGLLLIGPLLSALSSIGGILITLVPSITSLGTAFSLLLGPIGLLVAAVAGLYLAWKTNLFGIRRIGRKVFGAIKALITGDIKLAQKRFSKAVSLMNKSWRVNIKPLIKSARRIFNTIKRVISNALAWIMKHAVRPVLRSLRQLWQRHGQNIINSIKQLFNFIKGIFKVALGAIVLIWKHFGDEILIFTKFIFDTIGSAIKTALDAILTIFDVITDLMAGEWKTALNKLWKLAKRIFNGIIDFIIKWGSGFVGWVIDILADALDAFLQWGKDLIFGSLFKRILDAIIKAVKNFNLLGAVGKVLSSVFDRFYKFGQDIYNTLKHALQDILDYFTSGKIVSDFLSAGEGLVKALLNGIKNKIDNVMDFVEGKIQAIRDMLPGSDAKTGPLSDLTAAGAALPATLAKGIRSNIRVLERAAQEMAAAASPALAASVGMGIHGGVAGAGVGGAAGAHATHSRTDIRVGDLNLSIDARGEGLDVEAVEQLLDRKLDEREQQLIRALRRQGAIE